MPDPTVSLGMTVVEPQREVTALRLERDAVRALLADIVRHDAGRADWQAEAEILPGRCKACGQLGYIKVGDPALACTRCRSPRCVPDSTVTHEAIAASADALIADEPPL